MKTLERHLGPVYVISISLGAMLGAGLFVLPGIASAMTGPHLWLAFLFAGIFVVPGALSKSELATAMPSSGGTYLYIERAFGPLAGTVGGVGLWLSLILKSAFALIGLSWYLSEVIELPHEATALFFLTVIVALNIMGIRKVSKAQTFMVGLALLGLLLLLPLSIETFDSKLLEPLGGESGFDFCAGVALVYTAYAGVTKVAAIAEEVKNPGRNLPLGMLTSLVMAIVIYVGITYLMVGILDASAETGTSPRGVPGLQKDYHAMYTFAHQLGGDVFGYGMAILGVLIILSMGNAGVLASSRFPFAMSRDKLVPSVFGRIHPRYMTPTVSILFTGVVMAMMILSFDILSIAKLASSLKITIFIAVNLCVLVFRESGASWYRPKFRSPFYPWLQIFGILVGLFLLYMLGIAGLVALGGMVLPGLFLFLLYGRRHTESQGVLALRGPRKELRLEAARALIEHQDILPGEAKVVVALLGEERSPETLMEIGGALATGSAVDVMHVTDVPEQIMLDKMLDEDPVVTSLRRRIVGLAEELHMSVTFDPVVTRDILRTVHDTTLQVHCGWLVMEWKGNRNRNILQSSPIGWLGDHLACNFGVFKDSGARTFREILVMPKSGPHDALVVQTAENLADEYGGNITFAQYIRPDATEEQEKTAHQYLEQLRGICRAPERTTTRLISGPNEVKGVTVQTAAYDLLILGAPPETGFFNKFRVPTVERITQFSGCSVLQVKTPKKEFHASFESSSDSKKGVDLGDYLVSGCVEARVNAGKKEALFTHFADAFDRVIPETTKKDLESALWAREEVQNTGVGLGVALPHATLPGLTRSYLGLFTSAEPVPFGASDEVLADVFFVMVGPPEDRKNHLHLLSCLARLVSEKSVLERIKSASSSEELSRVLHDFDAEKASPDSTAAVPKTLE